MACIVRCARLETRTFVQFLLSFDWPSFAAGIAAGALSAPHCAAMCGPLSAAICERRSRSAPVRYQLGRLAGYTFVGSTAGQLGAVLSPLVIPSWMLPVAVALALLAVSLRLLVRSPSPRVVTLRTRPPRARLTSAVLAVLPREPAILGVLSALLPCGALAAAVLLATTRQSALGGALLMSGFAISSGAAVLAASALMARLADSRRAGWRRIVAPIALAATALWLLQPLYAYATTSAPHSHTAAPRCH
jgi:sulfite exporter TauE/SafE